MAAKDLRIAIVGGGIGGLTAAIALLQAGFDVQVYEQSRLLSEVGAGINIGPNASRLLIRLGLGEECAKVAFRSQWFHQRRWQDGRTLTHTPARRPHGRSVRRPAYDLPSRRAACAAGQGGATRAGASGLSLHRLRTGFERSSDQVRQRHRSQNRRADWRRRHPFRSAPHSARSRTSAVRLPGLSRPDPGGAGAATSRGSRRRSLGRAGTSSTISSRPAEC